MKRLLKERTITPICELAETLYNGLIKQYATFPYKNSSGSQSIRKEPCEISREYAKTKLKYNSKHSRSPIVRSLSSLLLNEKPSDNKNKIT